MIRVTLILTLLFVSAIQAAEPVAEGPTVIHAGTQTHCPIGGGEVVEEVFVDHEGQRIYFCCPGCDGPFLKDPAKHLSDIGAKGQTVASVQTICPVSGEAINSEVWVDHGGRRVFFSDTKHVAVFTAAPGEYLSNLK